MKELNGKVAVVTGAGSGIGRGITRRLAAEGMRVVMADIEQDALDEAAAAVRAESPGTEVLPRRVDVSSAEQVGALADEVFAEWGQVDVLCNNAGVFVSGFLWERPPADIEFALGVNLWGILHGIRAFVPRMMAQDTEGHVVNTSSVAGLYGSPHAGPYGISKFAAFAATEALASDLAACGSKIRASVLCPGIVATNIVGSDRNRPARLATSTTDDQLLAVEYLSAIVPGGMDPYEVGGIVVEGIRAEQFLILTDDSYAEQLRPRCEALVARRLPDLAAFS